MDPNTPVFPNNTPILFNGNNATISAVLEHFDEWNMRTQRFTLLVNHGAVSFRGRTFIDSPYAIPYIQEKERAVVGWRGWHGEVSEGSER